MRDAEDPRSPSLEELIKILRLARNFTILKDDETIRVSFNISNQDCLEQGLGVKTFGSLFLAGLIDNLDKLHFFEGLTKQFSNPDEKGATADDCISFLNNELKHSMDASLQSTLRRRFFSTIINKLTELGGWRFYADRERFEKARQEQRRQEEIYERAEKARRAYEKREKAKQPPPGWGSGFGGMSDEDIRRATEEASRRFEEIFRNRYENYFRDAYEGTFRFRDPPPPRDPPPNRRRSWWEILGVTANANKATIKSAWRRLAKKYHPDRCKEAGADKRMAEINAAKDEGLAGAPT